MSEDPARVEMTSLAAQGVVCELVCYAKLGHRLAFFQTNKLSYCRMAFRGYDPVRRFPREAHQTTSFGAAENRPWRPRRISKMR
jgi:hypothetical protein